MTFKPLFGEMLGTFILVAIGCGSIGVSMHIMELPLYVVALVWGAGVWLAIVSSLPFSPAHLNPAVSLGFCVLGKLPWRALPGYVLAQFVGAILAAGLLLFIFNDAIANYETVAGITRAGDKAHLSAMMFGEYYPNPGFAFDEATQSAILIPAPLAFLWEAIGTALLFIIILICARKWPQNGYLMAAGIGLGLAVLIFWIAPFTQAGFNPARDFGPRIVSWWAGWETAAFKSDQLPVLVYVAGPLTGVLVVALATRLLLTPKQTSTQS